MLRDMQGHIWCCDYTTAHRPEVNWSDEDTPMRLRIECVIEGKPFIAHIDTGAPWSVLGGQLIYDLEDALTPLDQRVCLQTAHGLIEGELHRINMTLMGEGASNNLDLSIRVIVANTWTGPPLMLGMRGCLDSFRWAFDAGFHAEDTPRLFFGELRPR
jgi:hypothetical protein